MNKFSWKTNSVCHINVKYELPVTSFQVSKLAPKSLVLVPPLHCPLASASGYPELLYYNLLSVTSSHIILGHQIGLF